MTTTDDEEDSLLASEKPNIGELRKDFDRSGGLLSNSVLRSHAENVRFMRWEGQALDGKKHREKLGREPFPFDGSSDVRIPLADDIITDLGSALENAFNRGQLSAEATEPGDISYAANVQKVLTKYRDRMKESLAEEISLMWNYGLGSGKGIWEVTWERRIAMGYHTVSMEEFVQVSEQAKARIAEITQQAAAQQRQPFIPATLNLAANLPDMVMDPSQEDEVVVLLQKYVGKLAEKLLADVYDADAFTDYKLKKGRARQVVRDLRETGSADFPVPHVVSCGPRVMARKVGEDIFLPPEAVNDLQRAPSIHVREFLTEAEIREYQVTEGWDEAWCKEVLNTCEGKTIIWATEDPKLDVSDTGTIVGANTEQAESRLFEVLWAYKRYVTEDGVPQIMCTIYSPHVTQIGADETYAKHYVLPFGNGKYNFRGWKRESFSRRFHESRSVSDIVGTWQDVVKRQVDMLIDRSSLETSPPVVAANRLKLKYYPGPGSLTQSQRDGDVKTFPPPTGNPELALKLIELIISFADNYFGRISKNVPDAKWQSKLQALVNRFMASVSAMFKLMLEIIQEMADESELSRIAGSDVQFPKSPDEIAGQYDVSLSFDVKDLDMGFVYKKLEAVMKLVVPLDAAGVLDRAKLVQLILMALDPKLAETLVVDKNTASQKLYQKVNNDFMLMYSGNDPEYGQDDDPTAEAQLQFGQQIVFGDGMNNKGNQKYQQAMQEDPIFRGKVEKWQQNKQFAKEQQNNKMVGRTGVGPES